MLPTPPPRCRPAGSAHSLRTPRPSAGALLVALLSASLLPSPAASSGVPTPLDADIQLLNESFEGAFPGALWAVNDSNAGNGTDYWARSTARNFTGNASVWSAGEGVQTVFWRPNMSGTGPSAQDPFEDGFEAGSANWSSGDFEPANGTDYWGRSTFRSHNGTTSLWVAQNGYNDYNLDNNSNVHQYDNDMDTIVWRDVDLSWPTALNATSVTLEFWFLAFTEQSADFFHAVYYDGSTWTNLTAFDGDSPSGWAQDSVAVPLTATRIGFRFTSNDSGILEGAYVDDVRLYSEHDERNAVLRTYDIDMNATMTRAVNLTAFASARVEYRYFLDTDSAGETLAVVYQAGGNWTYTDLHSGSSGGWQLSTAAVPVTATRFGFRFLSDSTGQREGAYLDDIRLIGHVLSPTCTASVSPAVGYEYLTVFNYTVVTNQGLRPYNWSWNFSDGPRLFGQNNSRTYAAVGTHAAVVNVTDAAGQTCTATAPTVTILHDTTGVSVSAPDNEVTEGNGVASSGWDARGHPLVMNWTLEPPSCGALSAASGESAVFTASVDAGGASCNVTGAFGNLSATVRFNVTHNLSAILITPGSAEVVEGGLVHVFAVDAAGHALNFTWSASCGGLSNRSGPSTDFNSSGAGGTECRVAAALGGAVAISTVNVSHDTSVLSVFPATFTLLEGGAVDFAVFDLHSHPTDGSWSVTPPACGAFTPPTGNATTLAVSTDAGAMHCTVTVTAGAGVATAALVVLHDVANVTLAPDAAAVEENGTATFSLGDNFGHPFSATWAVTPLPCGSIVPAAGGGSATFRAATTAGGLACNITATSAGRTLRAGVSVTHGAPESVVISPASAAVVEGGQVDLVGAVKDPSGHTLAGLLVTWSSACADLSTVIASASTASFADTTGGTTCAIRASFSNLSATADFTVEHRGPFALTLEPASATTSGGGTQALSAIVTDANGHLIAGANVAWSSTCGALSASTGPSVTFTAPSDLGGAQCTVTATLGGTGGGATASGAVTTPMSVLLPILIVVPAAAAAVGFLWWRKHRPPPPPKPVVTEVPEEPKPTFDVEIR